MVALTANDFGSFVTHPLLKPPGLEPGKNFEFKRDGASIDAKAGTVVFFGVHDGETYKCTLSRNNSKNQQRALVTVESQDAKQSQRAQQLTSIITQFFNEMVFELDGTFLSFQDMMVTSKGGEPSVMLALQITVKKFPSPGIAF